MINNIFTFNVLAVPQPAAQSIVVSPFESSTLWIYDAIAWWLVWSN